MIDKESEVFDRIAEALEENLEESVDMTSVYVNKPKSFPHVSIEQVDSRIQYEDSSGREKYAAMTFEVNIYSNKQGGRKYQCKKIAAVIDDVMNRMNFRRTAMSPVRNSTQTTVYGTDVHDETVYRLAVRYEGVASETHFYRR